MKYQTLDLVQGTLKWLDARYDKLTASQAPILFDLSPYSTRLQLFEEKIMRTEKSEKGKELLFQRGHDAEAKGRLWVKEKMNIDFKPTVVVSTEVPDLLASLDGFEEKEGIIFEAKYMGRENFEKVKKGKVPPHHEYQVQAQLLATGANKCVYFAMDGSDAALIDIYPDKTVMDQLAPEITKFMADVRAGTPPKPSERDFIDLDDPRLAFLRDAKLKADEASDIFDALKKEIINTYKDLSRFRGHGIEVIKSVRKGNVDYKSIPQIKNVDLDRYRKGCTETITVRLDKSFEKIAKGKVS